MLVLSVRNLAPGKMVWLENNGFAFKELHLSRVMVLAITKRYAYFFPLRRLPLAAYNTDLIWRCWDENPDLDSLCETEWSAA